MLTINARKRGFLKDGAPFFWLGDTAWLLFSRLNDDEIEVYLRNRAAKGFTVIQATLSHFDNYAAWDGSPAFIDNDFAQADRLMREFAGIFLLQLHAAALEIQHAQDILIK